MAPSIQPKRTRRHSGRKSASTTTLPAPPHSGKTGTSGLTPLRRVNLVEEVVAQLCDEILSGRFAVGEALPPEGQLGEAFGVSRTVIREAMKILSAQGLVEISQGRAPRVRPLDLQHVVETLSTFIHRAGPSLLQLLEVRRPLETEIAALAAQHATPAHIEALEKVIAEQRRAKTLEQRVNADVQFHNALAEATGNPVFQLLLGTLADLMRRSRRTTISRTGNERALIGHLAVLEAIRQGDSQAAHEAMHYHLGLAGEDLQQSGD